MVVPKASHEKWKIVCSVNYLAVINTKNIATNTIILHPLDHDNESEHNVSEMGVNNDG